ncbi:MULTISPECIES: OsmC family protein [unclassified Sinorhizobium]|uniref:OsmC family protein n=1 Tax=unclassified Sinorhizobium TaxID=2613772 RepID=UPI0024C3C73A|nr:MULTISPECIES: OsmC family protein [unclassified Sinorhizobium]MDK1373935.1 OsmC family protein [Sinorhizobium sp. 6-70]MDK1478085.1 OsmC family protein [Sinorhizobium sp. 6-117]
MAELKVRTRETGATAVVGRTGFPHVMSVTGAELDIVTGPSQPGYGPLDLLYASLASCLVLSARIAASRFGVLDRLTEVSAKVTGEKAHDEPSRVARFDIEFSIKGDFDDTVRHAIAEAAENEICTVSNTLRGNPAFTSRVSH